MGGVGAMRRAEEGPIQSGGGGKGAAARAAAQAWRSVRHRLARSPLPAPFSPCCPYLCLLCPLLCPLAPLTHYPCRLCPQPLPYLHTLLLLLRVPVALLLPYQDILVLLYLDTNYISMSY